MVQPLEPVTLQSRVGPPRTSICTLRGSKEVLALACSLSLHPHSLHADRGLAWAVIAHWSRKGDKEGWHLPASPMQRLSHMHTCSWQPASSSLHWVHPGNCRLLQWFVAHVPEEGWKPAEYSYILQPELLSRCSQALIFPRGKYCRKERQGAGYHANLPGQILNGATQGDAPLRPPENLPYPI